jgi:hypothetical protein
MESITFLTTKKTFSPDDAAPGIRTRQKGTQPLGLHPAGEILGSLIVELGWFAVSHLR